MLFSGYDCTDDGSVVGLGSCVDGRGKGSGGEEEPTAMGGNSSGSSFGKDRASQGGKEMNVLPTAIREGSTVGSSKDKARCTEGELNTSKNLSVVTVSSLTHLP